MTTALTPPRARTPLLALACALLMVLTALAVPARAADPAPISGRVVFPAGYTYSEATPPRIELRVLTGVGTGTQTPTLPATFVPVAADGTFTVARDLREGRSHLLLLHDGQHRLLSGYVTATGTTALFHTDAAVIEPGTTGLVVNASLAAQVSGRLQLPASYTNPSRLTIEGVVGTTPTRRVSGTVHADGTFVVGGVPAGTAVHLTLADNTRALHTGTWNAADGFFVPSRADATPVTAPASGLTVPVNPNGSISGRIEAPDYSPYEAPLVLMAVTGTAGTIEGTRLWSHDDGTFTLDGLDTGRSYALVVASGLGLVDTGVMAADGSVLPAGDDLSAVWSRARLMRPGTTGVVLRPTLLSGIRGRVVVPEGFAIDPDENGALVVHLYQRDGSTGQWAKKSSEPVREDGTFAFAALWLEPKADHALWLEPNHATNPRNAPFAAGFWTGSTTPLSTDVADAKLAAFSTTRDVLIPLAVQNVTRPAITGTARTGATLQASTGTWNPSSATTSVQWLRDGAAISGATSSSYTVTAADSGKKLSVRVTAKGGTGWLPTTVTSAPVTVTSPIVNVTRVSISGTVGYGKTVWVKRGEWSPDPVSTSVQWLRDGVAISGATGSSYKVGKSDVGTKLSVRVTAKGADGSTARSTSVQTKVPKVTPTVKVSVPSVKAGTALKATVTVDSAGLVTKPLGTVAVTVGSKTVKVTLTASHAGKVTVTLPAQAKGSHKVTAKYSPTSTSTTYLNGATSSAVTVKVT
ncbi:Ig-like domain repeat protein [Cellulomonas palmilytica]|uniref:Ig-like domain repeat protein n=1 Tax=Cellulomonas palmilytica TaxID=2608402 RepID=UPI001F1A3B7A|nr:Ig-like domain repeat protein [Cellulomonas palmilytica]UJP40833.1 Ig-like domain repeat protein [Cellulomonas palmilytica]